jgi:membrane protease YdiL (CAAX protease family)
MKSEASTSATDQPRPIWDIGAGLLAFMVILLSQQTIGKVISFGLPVTTAIWLVIPLGEIIAVAFLFVYIHQTGRSIRTFLGDLNLQWWEVTLVPIGLFIVGQLFGQVGNLLFSRLGGTVPDMGRAGGAIVPHMPLQFLLATLGAILGGGFCEEFIFRSYLLSAISKQIPKMLAAIITIIMFGAIHVMGFGWYSLVNLALWAIPITMYVIRSGKLIPAMMAHALNDVLIFVILLPLFAK